MKQNRWGPRQIASAADVASSDSNVDFVDQNSRIGIDAEQSNRKRDRWDKGQGEEPKVAADATHAANKDTAIDTSKNTASSTTPNNIPRNKVHTKNKNTKNRWAHLFFGQPDFRNSRVFSLKKFECEEQKLSAKKRKRK